MTRPDIRVGPETKRQPRLLDRMEYQAEGLGYFPILKGKVKHVITWGPTSKNMSPDFGKEKEHGLERTRQVMNQLHMAGFEKTIRIDPRVTAQQEIQEVTSEMLSRRSRDSYAITHSNFIYTTDPSIALVVKPADCTASIIHTVLPNGKPLLGLLHAGRAQVDELIPKEAIKKLLSLGCRPEDIHIGVAPSAQDYFMTNDTLYKLSHLSQWRENGFLQEDSSIQQTHLDILGFLLHQFIQNGIPVENIQPYSIDTQKAAAGDTPEGFSHSYAFYAKNPDKDGRFLVASQLED